MNLMDMLTGDTPGGLVMDSNNEMVSVLNEAATNITKEITQPRDGIYYLPTVLTKVQQELTEIALNLFGSKLLKHISSSNKRASISSLLDTTVPADVEELRFQEVELIYDQLFTICAHPSLLVDHFIPKKLLLSEINENLISTSGNFQLFNRIVDSIVREEGEPVHVLVVASSVKELELVESLIIGKRLYYDNLSRDKLYEDHRSMPDTSKADCKLDSRLFLYLVTSSQLYNHYSDSLGGVKTSFNFIFSFDRKINTSNPSIELLRPNNLKTPIIIPIPVFSVQHMSCLIDEPQQSFNISKNTSNPIYKHKFQIISTMAVNRSNIIQNHDKDFFYNVYGPNMFNFYDWLCKWDKENVTLEPLKQFNEKAILHFSDGKLTSKLSKSYLNHDFDVTPIDLNYKDFKPRFTELIYRRLSYLDSCVKEMEDQVEKFNKAETARQLQYDEDEEIVAEKYRKLRKLNEDAVSAEHRLARVEAELKKNEENANSKREKLAFLQEKINSDELDSLIERQEESAAKLTEELSNIENEFEKLNDENETIRSKYQNSSTEAVQLSASLNASKDYGKALDEKLKGVGASILPSLIRKDAIMNLEHNLQRLRKENDFVSNFMKTKIEKLLKERQSVLDNMNGGSTSRPNNRISKSSTPF